MRKSKKYFPDYKLGAIRELIVPELKRRVPDSELSAALAVLIKDGAKPLRTLADIYSVHHVTLRRWLKAAGKQPQGMGGRTNREEMFLLSDAQEVCEKWLEAKK